MKHNNVFDAQAKPEMKKIVRLLRKDRLGIEVQTLVVSICSKMWAKENLLSGSKPDEWKYERRVFTESNLWYSWNHVAALVDYLRNGCTDREGSFFRVFDPDQFIDPENACRLFFANTVSKGVLSALQTQEMIFKAKNFSLEELVGHHISAVRYNLKDAIEVIEGKMYVKDLKNIPDELMQHCESIRQTKFGVEVSFESKNANKVALANLISARERLESERLKREAAEMANQPVNEEDSTLTIEFVDQIEKKQSES